MNLEAAVSPPVEWLLASDEPWTRYGTLVDLMGLSESDHQVIQARQEMIRHPLVQSLLSAVAAWPGPPIRRHNDSAHPIHQLAILADMGFRYDDSGLDRVVREVTARSSPDGLPLSLLNIPTLFGGTGTDSLSWMLCDATTLLSSLARLSKERASLDCQDSGLLKAAAYLASLADDNGWRCKVAPDLGKFHGPGKRSDPCPIANLLALKALAPFSELRNSEAARAGAQVLLTHWDASERARRRLNAAPGEAEPPLERPYLFGCGSEFRKLRYPMVWYDCLHALHALRPYPFVQQDSRFQSLKAHVRSLSDAGGRFTASAMYRPWQGWSFADKKRPSPWLTLVVWRELQ